MLSNTDAKSTISGVVKSNAGEYIYQAEISLWRGKIKIKSCTTAKDGTYSLTIDSYGDFNLLVSVKEGLFLKFEDRDFRVKKDESMVLNLKLSPKMDVLKHYTTRLKESRNQIIRNKDNPDYKKLFFKNFPTTGIALELYFNKKNKKVNLFKYDQTYLDQFFKGKLVSVKNYTHHIVAFCLLDYFPNDFLMFIDESHVTIPQIKAMYGGDRSRKVNLVEYGFRLPAAMDNRPLKFEEFENLVQKALYVSATPADFELEKSEGVIVEQVIRPTGLLDPII